jgi:hypothetical protein
MLFPAVDTGQVLRSFVHFQLTHPKHFTVKCTEGTFFNDEEECIPCPVGTYQDVEGATSCSHCPEGTWTLDNQATNITDCIGMVTIEIVLTNTGPAPRMPNQDVLEHFEISMP